MNRLLIIFFLAFQVLNSQSLVDFKFYDSCTDSIIRLEYSVRPTDLSMNDLLDNKFPIDTKDSIISLPPNKYIINVVMQNNSLDYAQFSFTKSFLDKKKYNDTINIPKVLQRLRNTGQYGHLSLGYFNCDEICDGHIIDYYSNGKIKYEGDFNNGIPLKIKKYDINGKLISVEVYDKDGVLKEIKKN